jgi:negative regulator of flagellin synthesis FlgM
VKINQSTSPRTDAAAEGSARTPASPAGTSSATPAAGVSMSPLAAQVREISSRLANETDGDIDVKKVEEIRDAIAKGLLPMDASKIADGLLATLRELSQGSDKA